MSEEEYEDELVTSHSDENPELTGRRSGPLAAYSQEGSAVSELYKQDDTQRRLGYVPKQGETVVYEDIYIPPEE